MMISTKGRYALRVMLDLAEHDNGDYIPLKDIAARGKGGGYRLCKPAGEYSAGEIVRLAEGGMAPVSCLKGGSRGCERADDCLTLPLWEGLDQVVREYLDSVSLASLLEKK